jgi:molybdate transport system substrate-binding protein
MRFFYKAFCSVLLIGIALGGVGITSAAERPLTIAVAANALRPIEEIARNYEEKTGEEVRIVSGSTGKLYAQIVQGAPFDVFFAADTLRPDLLVKKGLTDKESFVYVSGKLAIWSASELPGLRTGGLSALTSDGVLKIAVANPKTAPYGKAAIEAMKKKGLLKELKGKLVYGESVSQAFSFAKSGNADAAIVSTSMLVGAGGISVEVDPKSYLPIAQSVVSIKGAPVPTGNFLEFVRGEVAAGIFKRYGYHVEP